MFAENSYCTQFVEQDIGKHIKVKIILYMLCAYILCIVEGMCKMPLSVPSDELGAIVGAASLAGKDWSGVIGNSGYYGFGYYALFFWLFKITDSPIIIYRIILMCTAFIRVMIIPISFYIGKKFLMIKSDKILLGITFIFPFISSSRIGEIDNEYILEFLIWLELLLICKKIQYGESKKNISWTLLLVIVSCYCLFIHTRALALVIAVICVLGIYGIIKKKMFSTILFSITLIIGYLLSKR